jgi:predicted DNA-binding protein
MSVLTIRLPNEKHERLKALAKARGMSVNKLIEELSTIALAEFDAETRFRALAAQGDPKVEIAILDKLDSYESSS